MTEELGLQMESIREFGERVDARHSQKFNYLRHFREQGRIPPTATRVDDLDKSMQSTYRGLLEEYKRERYEHNWQSVIKRHLDYENI